MKLKKYEKMLKNGHYTEVINSLESIIASDSNSFEVWSLLSRAYNLNNEHEKARDSANHALKIAPNLKSAMNELFFASDQLENFDIVITTFRDYINLYDIRQEWPIDFPSQKKELSGISLYDPSPKPVNLAVKEMMKQMMPGKSRPPRPPQHPSDLIATRIKNCFTGTRIILSEKVIDLLQLLVESFPNIMMMKYNLGFALVDKKKYDKVFELMNVWSKGCPSDPLLSEILGLIYLKKQDYDLSILTFKETLNLLSNDYNNIPKLSNILYKIDDGLNYMRDTIFLATAYYRVRYYLATAYYSNENYAEALECCENTLDNEWKGAPAHEKLLELKRKIMDKMS